MTYAPIWAILIIGIALALYDASNKSPASDNTIDITMRCPNKHIDRCEAIVVEAERIGREGARVNTFMTVRP